MTNQEQDLLEAYQIWCLHLNVIAGMGAGVDKADFAAQLARLQTAANKFLALPRPAPAQQKAA